MLSAPFKGREAYLPLAGYKLLPFRFGELDPGRYFITNDAGEYVVMPRREVESFVQRRLPRESETYRKLKAKHFLYDDDRRTPLELLAMKVRTRAEQVANFTGLHIFVVTLRCDHSCHYCQVSRQTEDKASFDMSRHHADLALDHTFRSPSACIKIEMQGGEALLNFDLVRYIVEGAEQRNLTARKDLQFVIATNLSRVTDEVLEFCRGREVFFSTSLDGPEALHNAHRPLRGGNSYLATLEGIKRVRTALGPDRVSALMTTTPASLDMVESIVDEYVAQGFESIFLRSLSPYGFAVKTSLVRRYDTNSWLAFYKRGLAHVIKLARRGVSFREDYTSIVLQKMFAPRGAAYVDLQSPAGIGIGAVVFNYDGAVYASDEGRMLAEMGDFSFRLGHLGEHTYEALMTTETLLGPLEASVLESSPMCSDCPMLPYCGADPVFHRATQGEPVGHKAFSAFCRKQMGVVRHIVGLLEDDPEAARVLRGWV